jgi:hypothetical protein
LPDRMKLLVASVLLLCVGVAVADISGTDPPDGTCLCLINNGVNIRGSACGAIIGVGYAGACFTYTGTTQGCFLDGTYYDFYEVDYSGGYGWIAGTYLVESSASRCSNSEGYSCPIDHEGMRVHEMTTPTEYDCVDSNCQNTCMGGQCVALVTCGCTKNGQWPPGTQCWAPGTPLKRSDGTCNSDVPSGTAIATFTTGGVYYAGHAAIFVDCLDAYTIRVWDQWCCSSIGYSNYPSSHSYYSTFAVVTNPGCADRGSWECRWENGGPTCCDTSEPGCQARKGWWTD